MKYNVYQPSLTGNEKKYVNECLESTWISSKGRFIKEFEKKFANYIGVKHGTAVCNGTVALHLAGAALGLGNGDEIIVPSFTYIASANPFLQLGCKIVFCDSLKDTWQMDPKDIKAKITSSTKAIVVVHLYGHPCDMDKILKIAHDNNIFVIEDCAEAIGSEYKGKKAGSFGDISCFSFFGNKTITCGEGGMVMCNNDDLHERVEHMKGQGVVNWKEYWHDIAAFNYRMTNIQAAIGLAQLEQIDKFLKQKHQIAQWYQEKISTLPLEIHKENSDVYHSYWMISVLTQDNQTRNALREYLKNNGIETRPLFPCIHQMPIYNRRFLSLSVAENISARGLNLPSYPGLEEQDIDHICSQIARFYAK